MSARSASGRLKLPVPGAWQPAVEQALAHLAARLGVPRTAVAVTRADDGGTGSPAALDLWLMAGGRTYRYVVGPAGALPAGAERSDPPRP